MTTKHVLTIAAATLAFQLSHAGDVTFGGFISNGYLQSSANNYLADTEDGDFDFVEAGINATWVPMDRTTVRGQLFTFELGPYGNFDPLVDYLFVDYNVNPAFGLRVGRVKRPEGIYTDIQDIDVARTTILLPAGMYDARFRDFSASLDGVSIYGNLQAGNSSFDYTIYHGSVEIDPESGIAAAALTDLSRGINNAAVENVNSDKNTGIQLWWNTPVSGLRVGSSYSYYNEIIMDLSGSLPVVNLPLYLEARNEATRNGFSAEYYLGDWTFVSEFISMKVEGLVRDTVAGMTGTWANSESRTHEAYISASRRFLDRFEGAITLSEYYGDKELKSSPADYLKDTQFSLRYNATDNWTLKAEIHMFRGTQRVFNQLGQNPGSLDTSWNLFAAKSTFVF